MNDGMVTIASDELLIVRLSGVFDGAAILSLAHELNSIEASRPYPKRLVFVADNLTTAITSNDIILYKTQRPALKTAVQSALCAFNDFQYGFARMFQTLLEGAYHRIEIFRDMESASEWLHVDIGLLRAAEIGKYDGA
jgi:hypothetical protein